MRAAIKYFNSPDVFDLENFAPDQKDNFNVFVQLMVGPIDTEGYESFDIVICTPKWLLENHDISDIIFGNHYLIVFEYNYKKIYNKLKEKIDNLEADTWDEIALKIGKIGKWEFEDYNE
jgi:hypothetical protein